MLDVIALGEPMLEFAATSIARLSEVTQFKRGWGGDTSNFAIAVARLGGRVGYITRLGDDEFGRCFLDLWQREGVDVSRVGTDAASFTAVYFISLRPDGAHDFTYYRQGSAASRIRPQDLDLDYIRSARVLHVSGISQAISDSACETVFAAIETARAAGNKVSYDPNLRLKLWSPERARDVMRRTAALADYVLPSIEEAQWIWELNEPEAIAQEILGQGAKLTAIKLGAEGCLVAGADGRIERVTGFQVNVLDTTAAGDSFDAAFILGILNGQSAVDTARFANAVGALTCMGAGAAEPIPTRTQVLRFLESAGQVKEKASS
jgi:2-dehydro-3-deoxygluconokinase